MTDIIEKSIAARDLPPHLRGDIELDAAVLVSVRRLTQNGFTEEFEAHALAADKSAVTESMEAKDALALLRKMTHEDKLR